VELITSPDPGLPVWVYTALGHVMSWKAALLILGVLVLAALARLLAEWQRRKTLVALMRHAPGGTVIVQGRGRGGPAMWVTVGSDPKRKITSRGGQ
jgi:hypothetical protein